MYTSSFRKIVRTHVSKEHPHIQNSLNKYDFQIPAMTYFVFSVLRLECLAMLNTCMFLLPQHLGCGSTFLPLPSVSTLIAGTVFFHTHPRHQEHGSYSSRRSSLIGGQRFFKRDYHYTPILWLTFTTL